jgi:hypothetical protein
MKLEIMTQSSIWRLMRGDHYLFVNSVPLPLELFQHNFDCKISDDENDMAPNPLVLGVPFEKKYTVYVINFYNIFTNIIIFIPHVRRVLRIVLSSFSFSFRKKT